MKLRQTVSARTETALWLIACLLLGLIWLQLAAWAPVTDDGAPISDDGWADHDAADSDDGEGGSVTPP